MIIDVHYHYIPLPPGLDLLALGMVDNWVLTAACAGVKKPMNEVMEFYNENINDIDCKKLIKRMDKNSIDVTALLLVDNLNHGFDVDFLTWAHGECAKAVANFPGRLIGLASVDPRRPGAPDLLRKFITEFNMKGLKFHPGAGYYPNSPEAYAVLQVADELGVPLLTHSAPLPEYAVKYSHPIHIDDIAHDFHNLKIITAHMGEAWWRDWLAIAKYKKNIFGDLSIWQLTAASNPHLFRRNLREILDTIGPERVLFGSDGPILEPFVSNRSAIDTMKALTKKGKDGISFSEEEVTAMLGGNAARIFNLS